MSEMKLQSSDDEREYIDTNRCITTDSLEMRAMLLALPFTPSHNPGVARRPSPEEEIRVAMQEKVQSDDDDGSDYDEEAVETKSKKRARRRGPDKKKVLFSQIGLILDQMQSMQRQGNTIEECTAMMQRIEWTDKKIYEFKTGLTSMMQVSNKSATATESQMMKYLTGLQNDHPDSIMSDECREMTYPVLQKATTSIEDQIFEAELEVKRLKNALKIHKFFLEVHREQTYDRCEWMAWLFRGLVQLESDRFVQVAQKTSVRKEFGSRRGGGGSGRSNEV